MASMNETTTDVNMFICECDIMRYPQNQANGPELHVMNLNKTPNNSEEMEKIMNSILHNYFKYI